jgi:general secretion pathway protein C
MKHLPILATFILLLAVCASAAYWWLELFKPPARPIAAAPQPAPIPLSVESAAELFGGKLGDALASNFQLKGVIEDGPDGVAILVADGKPAQAVGVNMEAAPGVTVKEIHLQYVLLDQGGRIKRVDLPESPIAGVEFGAPAQDGTSAALAGASPTRATTTVYRSGGAMPMPVPNTNVGPIPGQMVGQMPGLLPGQMPQIRRPAGIGPPAFGAKPTSAPRS